MVVTFLRWCLLLTVCAGCMTATLKRARQPDIESRIVGSDARVIYVRNDAGKTFGIPRNEVADIDHPGNVLVTIGVPLAAVGGLYLRAAGDGSSSGQGPLQAAGFVFLTPGVFLVGLGLYEWITSSNAASPGAGPPFDVLGQPPFALPIPLATAPTPG